MRFDRPSLFHSPVEIALVTSAKDFDAMLRRMKVKERPPHLGPGALASTHVFVNDGGGLARMVVSVGPMPKGDLVPVLAHEAVHVWQEIKEFIGEEKPSHEFEAYAVQNLIYYLRSEYLRQTRRGRKAKR